MAKNSTLKFSLLLVLLIAMSSLTAYADGLQVQIQDLSVGSSLQTLSPTAGSESLTASSLVVGNFTIVNLSVSSHYPLSLAELGRMDLNSSLRNTTGSGELQILLQYTGLPGDVNPMTLTGTAVWFVSLGNASVTVKTWAVPDGGSPVTGLNQGPLTSASFSVTDSEQFTASPSYTLYTQVNISSLTKNRTASIQTAAIVERDATVPEPTSLILMVSGLAGLIALRRKNRVS
jgi:hypothetical protein